MVLLLVATACGPAELDREAWLHQVLLQDNLGWMNRDNSLLAEKFSRMGADDYNFMRATAGVLFADVARLSDERVETSFLTEPQATQVFIVGDAHPENFGTVHPGEGPFPTVAYTTDAYPLPWEIQDLDVANFGPYTLDVRRAAQGLAALCVPLTPLTGGDVEGYPDEAVEALALAYVDEIEAQVAGAGWDGLADADEDGEIVEYYLEEALEEGAERKRLFGNAEVDANGELWFVRDEALDETGHGQIEPTDEEWRLLERLMAAYEPKPEGFRMRDAVRRYGSGITSVPALRFRVLWDQGADGPDDDQIFQLRELVDPPEPPGRLGERAGFTDNPERLQLAIDTVWTRGTDSDVRATALLDGDRAFKSLTWSSWVQGVDHDKLLERAQDGKVEWDDLVRFGALMGRALAAAHARAPLAGGGDALPVIAADLSGDRAGFAAEVVAMARHDLDQLEEDADHFDVLLEAYGPLLGLDDLADGLY